MRRILLAGSTGYLGRYVAKELRSRGFFCRAIARNPDKLEREGIEVDQLLEAELTDDVSIEGCCEGVDTVVSCVGITRQKDGLTYMDVDYRANLNLLEEARKRGVRKFVYVSVLNGEHLRHLKICEAKERFVEKLKTSGMEYCVVRPNGFFSDMSEFFNMARKGRIFLFGGGAARSNPIHGADLAVVCVDAIEESDKEVRVGGPETLSQEEIAMIAFEAAGREPKIVCVPDWVRLVTLKMIRMFTGSRVYGPIEFFLTVMAMDMVAPEHGKRTLKEYFTELKHAGA
ncbi:MAG: SDR family NAD(P)-dependent oxidoreductase [Proteobacteria bacterium]|nr:MAG: SDR family NAD(P)-dependent oxidoreductase [Pseudomonadota bacterium]